MNYYFIPAALILTLIVIALFSIFLKRPLRGFSLVFILLFLATWTGQLWITPFGPVTFGIAWMPLVFISLLFSTLVLALSTNLTNMKEKPTETKNEPVIAAGLFFWIILIILVLSIIAGHYRNNTIVPEA